MKKWMMPLCLAGAMALSTGVSAQPPSCPMGPMGRGPSDRPCDPGATLERILQHQKLAETAGITQEQIKSLQAVLYQSEKDLIQAQADSDLARVEVKHLLQGDKPDQKLVLEAIDKAGQLQTNVEKLRVKTMLQVREIVDDDTMAQFFRSLREQAPAMKKPGEMGQAKSEWRTKHKARMEMRQKRMGMKASAVQKNEPPPPAGQQPPPDDEDEDEDVAEME